MIRTYYILVLILVGFSFANANTKNVYTNNCISAQYLIFNLELDKATEILKEEQRINPDNLIPIRLFSYIDFLKAFISEEEKYHQELKSNTKERLDFLRNTNTQSAFNMMIQGEITLHLSISEFKSKEFLSAAWDLRKSYKLLLENKKLHPEFKENNLGLGMLHTILGATPERYKWIMSMAGMTGDLASGIKELEEVYSYSIENNLSSKALEINVVRLLTEIHINKNYDEAKIISQLLQSDKNRTLINFTLAHYYMNTSNSKKAHDLLNQFHFNNGQFPFLYMYFLRGMSGLNQLDLSSDTYNDMNRFVTEFNGTNFIKIAYQKMAWYKFLTDDTSAYNNLMRNSLNLGDDFTDEDKQAVVEANRQSLPNKHLLRARVLFDGGLFKESKNGLENFSDEDFKIFKEKVEYNYRLARAEDALNLDLESIKHYQKTIDLSKDKPWYYAANSALKIAVYYEEKYDYANAKKYYNYCLEMNNTEYRNSIRQKAKTGINRIKNK